MCGLNSLVSQTIERIKHMIDVEQAYQPGDQLPGEISFSEQLGISRSTLREALAALENQHYIEIIKGKGSFVIDRSSALDQDDILGLARTNVPLKDLLEVRYLMEPLIASLAARNATAQNIAELEKTAAAVEAAIQSNENRESAEIAFHSAIAKATQNNFLCLLIPIISTAVIETVAAALGDQRIADSTLFDHRNIVNFIKQQQPEAAEAAMRVHLANAIAMLDPESEKEL